MESPIFSGSGGQHLQRVLQALGVHELTPLIWNLKNTSGETHLEICWRTPIADTSSNEQGPVSGPKEEVKEKHQCSGKTRKKRKSPATIKRDKERFRRWLAERKTASTNVPISKTKEAVPPKPRPRTRQTVRIDKETSSFEDDHESDVVLYVDIPRNDAPVTIFKPVPAPRLSIISSDTDHQPSSPSSSDSNPRSGEEGSPPPQDQHQDHVSVDSSSSEDTSAPRPPIPPRRHIRSRAPTRRFGYSAPGTPFSMRTDTFVDDGGVDIRSRKVQIFAELVNHFGTF